MQIMLDLETMGNGSNAAIISIGAVKFNPEKKEITDRFYSRVDLKSSMDAGMEVDASTIMWWMQQQQKARDEFKGVLPNMHTALVGFTAWVQKTLGKAYVWGNGATFDNVIMSNAYRLFGMDRPWDYKGDRCYRTVKALFPQVPLPKNLDHLMAHRADHDAEYQAIHLMEIWPLISQKALQDAA